MTEPEKITERLDKRIKELQKEIELRTRILTELKIVQSGKDLPF